VYRQEEAKDFDRIGIVMKGRQFRLGSIRGRFLVVCLTPRLRRVPPGALLLAENATEDGVPGCGAGLVCCLDWWLGQLGRGVSCRIVK
jgi:hypothetical protein